MALGDLDIKKILKSFVRFFGYDVIKHYDDTSTDNLFYKICCNYINEHNIDVPIIQSKSQFMQDLFVLAELNFKRNGYFVEFGCCDGVTLSNTWLLEKKFGWDGIVAEPSHYWHNNLDKNRTCIIDKRCISNSLEKEVIFNETSSPELSTIDSFSFDDMHGKSRITGNKYAVETVSLTDLLDQHNAPSIIDYLSIDTEGSEYSILSNFDFHKYKIKIISCEHNYTSKRNKIFNLLTQKGFQRKYMCYSKVDDWYVNTSI